MSSGTCGCQGYDLTQGDDYKIIMDRLPYAEFLIGSHSEDVQRQVVELLCSRVIAMGEQNQVSGGVCTHVAQVRCRASFDQRPSLPYKARTEVGLPTDQEDIACTQRKSH